MKIIYTNLITAVSSSASHLSTDYAIAKVENNFPKQAYIANAATATITVTCAGAEALFFSYLAEAVTVTFKHSNGSTLSTATYSNTYTLSEQYLLNELTLWNDSVFVACPTDTNTVEIALTNSTDVKGTLNGWVSASSGQLGRLQASSSNIYLEDYPQIKLGTFVSDGVFTEQINRITGDGTGTQDLQLSANGGANFTVSNMKLPLIVNTIRAGKVLETFNPNVGMSISRDSFGIRQERDSGLVYRLGEIRRRFSGSVQVLESERDTATKVFSGLRMQPVAAEILGYQTNTAVFGSFFEPATIAYSYPGSQLYDYNLEFVELI
jgi:hypothetical protein